MLYEAHSATSPPPCASEGGGRQHSGGGVERVTQRLSGACAASNMQLRQGTFTQRGS